MGFVATELPYENLSDRKIAMERVKGWWCTATRSEYRKVEELTLAGFFVITLLASTISG